MTPFGYTEVQDIKFGARRRAPRKGSDRSGIANKPTSLQKVYDLSETLVDLLGVTQVRRIQAKILKHSSFHVFKWSRCCGTVKAHEFQDPSDKRYIVCDGKM